MNNPILILFGALLTGVTAISAGFLLLQRLRLNLYRGEERLYAFVLGSACLSLLVFFLACAGLASSWIFGLCAFLISGACVWTKAYRGSDRPLPGMPLAWKLLFIACVIPYTGWYFLHAMSPEHSPDAISYHLALVGTYFRQQGFGQITTNIYANITMGTEMLFLFAFAFGRHSSAALVHFFFLMVLPLQMVAFGRRTGYAKAGVVGALLVFMSPLVGIDGSSAYVDVAMACVLFSLFCLLQIWDAERTRSLLIAIGLLAGFSYATKMTAFLAIPYALAFLLYTLLRDRQSVIRPLAVTSLCIGVMVVPWLAKNVLIVGNPFSPFLNRYFPNPYVHVSFEEEYRRSHQWYPGLNSVSQIPVELTIRGGLLNGLFGPIFLLAPLSLLALRWHLGRQILFAALLFGLTYPANVGSRFLFGALPFLAFAMGMVVSHWPGVAPAVVVFHAFFSWPTVIPLYCDPYAWRLSKVSIRAALRKDKEEDWLPGRADGFVTSKFIERHVPPGAKVFTFGGAAESYCDRELLVAYQGGLNYMLGEILASGMVPSYQALQRWTYRFPERKVRGIRLVQTESTPDIWSVSELRVYSPGRELVRAKGWRIKAWPNPWDVQLAFDNCPVTRWKTWQESAPREYVQVDFPEPEVVSGVQAELSVDHVQTKGKLEGQTEEGKWTPLGKSAEVTRVPPLPNPRRAAIDDMKRFGITHLAISNDEFIAEELFTKTKTWGVTFLGQAGNVKLYRLN